jgi:hypothetical protein
MLGRVDGRPNLVRHQAGMEKETRYYPSSPERVADACREAFRAREFQVYEDGLPDRGLRGHAGATLTTLGKSVSVTLDARGGTTAVTFEAIPDEGRWTWDESPRELRAFFEALERALG